MLFTRFNRLSAQYVAVVTAVSMILSAFPAGFFVAHAAGTLIPLSDVTIDSSSETVFGPVDASGHESIEFSFDYDATALDATPSPESFTYGWRETGGSDNDLGTILGLSGEDPTEIDSISVFLPPAAQVSSLEVYFNVTSNGTAPADFVDITNALVMGEETACDPQYDVTGPTDIENTDTGEYFDTIQDAIDDCDTVDGHTIEVSGGTHSEDVTVDKGVTLDGTKAATIEGQVRLEASDVTLKNFTVDGTATGETVTVIVPGSADEEANVTIENNTIMGVSTTGASNGAGIVISAADNVDVIDNIIMGISSDSSDNKTAQGILIGDTGESADLDDILISGNEIKDITGAKGAYGIIVNRETTALIITGNHIHDVLGDSDDDGFGWANGIGLDADTPEAEVTMNVIEDIDANTDLFGSIGIIGQSVSAAESILIEENDFLTDPAAENRTAGEVDMTRNWWGSTAGPAYTDITVLALAALALEPLGGEIFQTVPGGSVTFEPWLCGPFATDPEESVEGECIVEAGLEITDPASDGEVLSGTHTFTAEYIDEDETEDDVAWAIRSGATEDCTGGTNEAANVGGLSDPFDWDGSSFSAEVDMSDWDNGEYCFVVNPLESGDGESFREVRIFTLENKEPLVCEAGVNLAKNPSFEKPVVTAEKKWDILNLKKWKSEAADDQDPIDVEIQRGFAGWVSADGEQHVELDGDENTRIWQKIKTIPGEEYTLSWKYSARPDTEKPDSKMKVYVDGDHVKTNNRDGLDDIDWKMRSYTFVATKKKTEISFEGAGTNNSYGALLDDVSFECNPPEPATLEITNPEEDNEVLEGEHTFEALYLDDDDEEDDIRWAIRFETCEPDDTATVAGNVGGFSDPSDFSSTTGEFSATIDMSGWADGEYCFVVNPDEGEGEDDLREVRPFILDNPEPLVCEPEVNLLGNPSFEEPAIDSAWALVTPVAWLVEKVAGGSADMEIQRSVFGWSHSDGEQHTELAGNEADIITQTVSTIPGETYVLSWDYSPRPGKSFSQNKMEVYVDGDEVETNQESGVGLEDTDWSSHDYVFEATDTETKIAFMDAGPSNGVGPLLDNTSLTCGDPEEEYYYVEGYKWDDYDGNGYWEEYEYGLEGWTIEITNGSTTYSTTTDMYGYYYFKVPAGEWEVSEVQQYGWEQTAPHYYDTVFALVTDDYEEDKEWEDDEYYPGTCEFLVGEEYEIYRGEGRVDEETDEYIYICDFGNHYIAEIVDGYKWNDIDGDGEWDEDEEGIEGWEIEITNGTTTFSTTTDMYGYYYFEVEPGEWTVSEGSRSGWTQTYPTDPYTCTFEVEHMHKKEMFETRIIIDDEWEDDYYKLGYICDFGNQYEGTTNDDASLTCNIEADRTLIRPDSRVDLTWETTGASSVSIDNGIGSTTENGTEEVIPSTDTIYTLTASNGEESIQCSVEITVDPSGGGSSSLSGGGGGSVLGASDSQVAGESDSAPSCGMYLFDYMRMGQANDLTEVVKLQLFLRDQGYENLVTGLFDSATDASVHAFQTLYAPEVLQPWADLGLGDGSSTGYVFKTTRWKINNIVCPGSEDFPELP